MGVGRKSHLRGKARCRQPCASSAQCDRPCARSCNHRGKHELEGANGTNEVDHKNESSMNTSRTKQTDLCDSRVDASVRHESMRWLHADNSRKRSRNANRAALIACHTQSDENMHTEGTDLRLPGQPLQARLAHRC